MPNVGIPEKGGDISAPIQPPLFPVDPATLKQEEIRERMRERMGDSGVAGVQEDEED